MTVKDIEVRKKPADFCEAEGCEEKNLFKCRCCWNHLPEEEKWAYREYIIEKIRTGKDLSGANLYNVDLSRADLSNAKLSNANLSNANLSHANLTRANLSHADLTETNLSKANLSEANLFRANLFSVDLSGANLHDADLPRASLSNANLSRANLYSADLFKANLSKANLSHANLTWADLFDADLSGANLSGVNLSGGITMEEVLPHLTMMTEAELQEIIQKDKPGGKHNSLAGELVWFEEHEDELLRQYEGKFVAIKGEEVVCVKDSADDIVKEVYTRGATINGGFVKGSEVGDVLIRKVTREPSKDFIFTAWEGTRDG